MRDAMNPARAARKAAQDEEADSWTPPVLRTIAAQSEGIDELIDAISPASCAILTRAESCSRGDANACASVFARPSNSRVSQRLWKDASTVAWLEDRLPELESGAMAPFHVADESAGA